MYICTKYVDLHVLFKYGEDWRGYHQQYLYLYFQFMLLVLLVSDVIAFR